MKTAPLAIVALILTAALRAQSQPAATIDRVSWLQGCWEVRSGSRIVEEQWTKPRAGTMLALGRTTRDDRLIEYEMVIIREDGASLSYEAHPSGQPSAVFRSRERDGVTGDGRSVIFENLAHDFPQRVGYRRNSDDALLAWVEGTASGQPRRLEFPYQRVPCP